MSQAPRARRRKHPADALCTFAKKLPGAWEDMPWDDDLVVKVGKKVFVFFGSPTRPSAMGVKLPRTGPYALSFQCAEPSGYGLGRSGWVTVHLDRDDTPDAGLLHEWIVESYRTIAPKRLQGELPPALQAEA